MTQQRRRAQPKKSDSEHIDERAQQLFKLLVEQYLDEGVPVGSKKLAEASAIAVSSATVRNIMADLDIRGLVSSPHTSAGKVPTDKGLRLFIDSLISVQPLNAEVEQNFREEFSEVISPKELVESAAKLLSRVSHLAGLVTIPRPEQVELRQVEFLQLGGKQVLAILVVNEREVQNRVITTDRQYSDVELHRAANFINAEFSGYSLSSIRRGVLESMQADKNQVDEYLRTTLDTVMEAFEDKEEQEHDYVMTGERNLVEMLSTLDEVRSLLDAFTSKSAIIHLLDRCIDTEGIQLFIGKESGYQPLDDYSLITAPYEVKGQIAGALGVIGPTRMSYQKLIPLVDVTARLLGSAIQQSHT